MNCVVVLGIKPSITIQFQLPSVCDWNMLSTPYSPPAPLSKTLVDFWRMIWQEHTHTIVMVTNLKEDKKVKCQQYWPDSDSHRYGPFLVTNTEQQVFADYTIRLLQIEVGSLCSLTCFYVIMSSFSSCREARSPLV